MGTFTKSFGSCGGYIAGDHALVRYLKTTSPVRTHSAAQDGGTRGMCPDPPAPSIQGVYATSMSTPAAQQTLAALHVLQGKDGTTRGADKVAQLHANSNFFRDSLRAMGCEVLGDTDSPVMPVMLYNPGKIGAFSRECLARHLATVVVGFPATPLLLSRARVCISASHTREELEAALRVLEDVVDLLGLRYREERRKGGKGGEATQNGRHAPEDGAHLTNGHAR